MNLNPVLTTLLLLAPWATAQPARPSFKEHKLTAIDAWLTANKTGAERAEALGEAADLAFELASWERARGYAESYCKEFAKGEKAGEMQLMVGRALAHTPGGEAAARKVFQRVIDDAGDDFNAAVPAAIELADVLSGNGDKEGATKVLVGLGEKYDKVRGLKEFLAGKVEELDQIGNEPKPIDVKGLDGKPIKLADLKGKVVLIDFWATWCGPCIAELPNVIATYKKFHEKGFEVIGISLDEEEKKLRDFLASHEMPWAQFFDGKGWENALGQLYSVTSIPKTYLINREGKVHRVGVRGEALGREVEKLLTATAEGSKPAATSRPAAGK